MENVYPRISSFIAFFGALWLSVCIVTIFVLVDLSEGVLEQETFALDKTILLSINQLSTPTLDTLMLGITRMGDPKTVVPLTLVVLFLLLWKRKKVEARFFAINAFGGAVLSYALKLAFSKPRPDLWQQHIEEITYSYPSGHALGSVVLYGFIAYLMATFYPRYASAIYAIAIVLMLGIGFSRLYLGVHWPTDIVGGYGVGLLWITVCIMLMRLKKQTQQPEQSGN